MPQASSCLTLNACLQGKLCAKVGQVPKMARMESWCHLFARKFRAEAVEHLLRIYLNQSTPKVTWA